MVTRIETKVPYEIRPDNVLTSTGYGADDTAQSLAFGDTYVFSPSGTLMWQTPTTGRAVVTDGSGGVYLVGPGITKYEHCTFNSP